MSRTELVIHAFDSGIIFEQITGDYGDGFRGPALGDGDRL